MLLERQRVHSLLDRLFAWSIDRRRWTERGSLTVKPPENAASDVAQRAPAHASANADQAFRKPVLAAGRRHPRPRPDARASSSDRHRRRAKTAHALPSAATVARARRRPGPAASSAPCPLRPRIRVRCRFLAVTPNRMFHADTMAPASKSTVVRASSPSIPPLTTRAVVPITSPGTMVCTTVTPKFEVVSVRIGTSPDPPFCRSGGAETVVNQ